MHAFYVSASASCEPVYHQSQRTDRRNLMRSARTGPRISVVIPSYNQCEFLERTLRSIFDQDYPNHEVIVIDGASTDGTVKLLEKYTHALAYWESTPDRGQSHALNKGFAKATGDIFAWQNADDIYFPGAFSRVVEAFARRPDKSVVFGDYATIDADDRLIKRYPAFDYRIGQLVYEGFFLNAQATFWRRDVHARFGQFDEHLHRNMDYEMLLRFGLVEGEAAFLRIDDLLAAFRRHPLQKTQGVDATTIAEQIAIAKRWNTGRFERGAKLKWLYYRARRAYWYWQRNGLSYLVSSGLVPVAKRTVSTARASVTNRRTPE